MRVLLAEDEKRMASALVALLKQEKYDVDHMADGASALAALESGVYDIAVLDVLMPEMNGFEVARRARNNGIKTPILMLTAKSQLDAKVEGRAMATALTEGIIFTLILGLGMTCVLVWDLPVIGVLLGLVGLGGALYQKVLKKERAKAAPEILRLSETE